MSITVVTCSPLSLFPSIQLRVCRIALSNSSQRVSNFTQSQVHFPFCCDCNPNLFQDRRNFAHDRRMWMRPISDDDNDDEDRSLDLLVRFVQNVFKKVSKRARKAVRSVLPFPISTHLVGFSVNGILVLTFLWILKALLEAYFFWPFGYLMITVETCMIVVMTYEIVTFHHFVVCTLGSVVFISILSIRGIWSGVSFLQESRHQKMDELDVERNAWNGAQPVT